MFKVLLSLFKESDAKPAQAILTAATPKVKPRLLP